MRLLKPDRLRIFQKQYMEKILSISVVQPEYCLKKVLTTNLCILFKTILFVGQAEYITPKD